VAVNGGAPERFPGHDHGTWRPVAAALAVSWPAGHFVENLAVRDDGVVFASVHSHRRIDRYDPGTGSLVAFARLPEPVTGLAFDDRGILWATGGTLGEPPGYVWRISPTGTVDEWLQIPDALFMNGCAFAAERRLLLACESTTGRIVAVDLTEPMWESWISDVLLRPTGGGIPGANGIKLRDGCAWITVTDRNLLLRARILEDGRSGPLEVVADQLRADDFAFSESGAAYIATHPANTVLRLAPDGARTTIAGPAEGAVGSTSCAFGRGPVDVAALYVTTNGGMWSPYHGRVQDAKLVRLAVGETGERIPTRT
jgi:sugar lactone lactonase YvrE